MCGSTNIIVKFWKHLVPLISVYVPFNINNDFEKERKYKLLLA